MNIWMKNMDEDCRWTCCHPKARFWLLRRFRVKPVQVQVSRLRGFQRITVMGGEGPKTTGTHARHATCSESVNKACAAHLPQSSRAALVHHHVRLAGAFQLLQPMPNLRSRLHLAQQRTLHTLKLANHRFRFLLVNPSIRMRIIIGASGSAFNSAFTSVLGGFLVLGVL